MNYPIFKFNHDGNEYILNSFLAGKLIVDLLDSERYGLAVSDEVRGAARAAVRRSGVTVEIIGENHGAD